MPCPCCFKSSSAEQRKFSKSLYLVLMTPKSVALSTDSPVCLRECAVKRCCPLISSKPPKPTTSDFSLRKCNKESLTSGILSFLLGVGAAREGDSGRIAGREERR